MAWVERREEASERAERREEAWNGGRRRTRGRGIAGRRGGASSRRRPSGTGCPCEEHGDLNQRGRRRAGGKGRGEVVEAPRSLHRELGDARGAGQGLDTPVHILRHLQLWVDGQINVYGD